MNSVLKTAQKNIWEKWLKLQIVNGKNEAVT